MWISGVVTCFPSLSQDFARESLVNTLWQFNIYIYSYGESLCLMEKSTINGPVQQLNVSHYRTTRELNTIKSHETTIFLWFSYGLLVPEGNHDEAVNYGSHMQLLWLRAPSAARLVVGNSSRSKLLVRPGEVFPVAKP